MNALRLLSSLLFLALAARAGVPTKIEIWPEGVPGLRADASPEKIENARASNVHHPYLEYFAVPAGQGVGTAVIICPGGAYTRLAIEHEGTMVAARLNQLGVAAFVLHYRMVEYGHPAPLRDVLRAIRLVRSRATEFSVKPTRVGIIGFSAGGHLCATAATMFDDPEGRTGAELDAVSARPDFAAPIYPVITMKDPFAHAGSRRSLLGEKPTPEMVDHMSLELHVPRNAPPMFIAGSEDDKTVPVENFLMFYQALRNAGVEAELHLWPKGGHGYGMLGDRGPASTWINRYEDWLRAGGWLTAPKS